MFAVITFIRYLSVCGVLFPPTPSFPFFPPSPLPYLLLFLILPPPPHVLLKQGLIE